jgi:hypothetical protein
MPSSYVQKNREASVCGMTMTPHNSAIAISGPMLMSA